MVVFGDFFGIFWVRFVYLGWLLVLVVEVLVVGDGSSGCWLSVVEVLVIGDWWLVYPVGGWRGSVGDFTLG